LGGESGSSGSNETQSRRDERVWLPQRVCPAARRRRRQWAALRAALQTSAVVRCAVPRFETHPDMRRGGAHWTARPVGACLFAGLVLLDGDFYFLIDSAGLPRKAATVPPPTVIKHGPSADGAGDAAAGTGDGIAAAAAAAATAAPEKATAAAVEVPLPLLRLSAYDAATTLQCGPVEARGDKLRGTWPTAAEASRELWGVRVVDRDALAARLVVEGRAIAALGHRRSHRRRYCSFRRGRTGNNNISNSSSGSTDDNGSDANDDDAGPLVLPVRRVHIHNHGHIFEDAVQPLHWALNLLDLGYEAAHRDTLVLLADNLGAGPYDDRFRLISQAPPVHLHRLRDDGLGTWANDDARSAATCSSSRGDSSSSSSSSSSDGSRSGGGWSSRSFSSRRSSGRTALDLAACGVPGAACVLARSAVGVGGLGLHGCEYGLHPDTFAERRNAFLAFRATALRALSVPNHSGHSGRGTDGDDGGQDIGNGDDHDHGDDEPPDELSKGAAEASSTSAAASMEPVVVVRVLVVQRGDDRRIRNLPELAAPSPTSPPQASPAWRPTSHPSALRWSVCRSTRCRCLSSYAA
jgi:hypothetical protein